MEGNSSSCSRKSRARDKFTDLLLSWSLEDVIDEDLYRCQVEKIPESFESVDQYLDAYIIPLLEEVRCLLASAIEAIAEAPFCEIKSATALKHDELMYDVKVGCWENGVRSDGETYRTLRGDFVLISDSKPCDTQCTGWTCYFASVEKNHESKSGDGCTSSSIQLKTAHSLEIGDKESKSRYMVYLMNMTAQKRIWRALRMRKNLKIIEKVLTRNLLGEEDCEICPLKSHIEVEENMGSTLLSKLNKSQLKAVLSSVGNIECKHRFSVQLIWAPPGTGKTTTLTILLYILSIMKVRTVVCAPTNTAIAGLASRVIEVRNSIISEAEKSFMSCPEMLIIGDHENLKVCSDGCISQTSTSEFCFPKASLIFCTTNSSYKLHSLNTEPFHFLVIDEAAQQKEAETIIALQIPDVRHAILVGDEMQLSATVKSKLSENAGFQRSLFERLSSIGHPKDMLNVQYRMHPSISRFPNSKFYFNQILDAPNVQSESYERCYLQGRMFGSYSFINICGGREELDDDGHSRRNLVEVAVVLKLVGKLFKAWSGSKERLSIGLISPYDAQVSAIRDRIPPKYDNYEGFKVKVMSIDGCQGCKEDIIIISTVRSHKGGSFGSLSSSQRTNVALTRARHCLWILGNEIALSSSDSTWAALVADAKDRQCFFSAKEICGVWRTIIDVNKELDQLEDLLSWESLHFENSRWQVLFSENFKSSFQKLKSSEKKLALGLVLKVARGWRPQKITVDRTCKNSLYVVKQFKVGKYYIVCSVDVIKDSIYTQVLRVWDILLVEETSKLLKQLESIFCMYTDDFLNHCKEKLFEGNLEVPKTWPLCDDLIRFKNRSTTTASDCPENCTSSVEESKVSESLLLMKFYSLSTGAANYLLSDLKGREVALPFEVTEEEREIILFPRSSFILGRSGTGKTTILTMKLFQKHQLYCIASRDSTASDNNVHIRNKVDVGHYLDESKRVTLHQLFVTVSPKLCYAVKSHISQLISFARQNYSGSMNFTGVDDIDEMADFKDIPDTFIGFPQEKYPLIITFQKFLMMLDGTLGNSFFQRFRDANDFCHYESTKSVALQTLIRKKEVTYDRFVSLYWHHMNAKLTKNLDASRVFIEIMSHIKGGLKHGGACDRKLCREDYISLSRRRASTLSSEKREAIYNIFEDYEKIKLERGEFDLADLVMDIHRRLKKGHLLGDKMDFVYIDEVQDLTMRQILLFRYVCNNIDEGFVFSGDTAQTIARGIDFRFQDIRSLFYNEFLMKSGNCEVSGSREKVEKGLVSASYCLSQNFRTHTGVLKLAQSVVGLICSYFPNSIDSLPPETSRVHGDSPVVLKPGFNENSIVSIFGQRAKVGRKWVGFGADQVILVRDDIARNEIINYVGNQALVLTIVECKGLEFQDVLLYNFFGSSPMSNQWRVVNGFLNENDLHGAESPKSFPSFSDSRHNILCSELKQLYVSITRTRQRLWICENNAEYFQPMLDYWRRLDLVKVRDIDDSFAEAMQRASSPEEWKSRGIKLFWEKHYEMAELCFENAGEETWEKRAKASRIRDAAYSSRGSDIMLREAAEIFYSINCVESAVKCFCDLKDYERAGRIYFEKCGTQELRKAGECFMLAGNYRTAAEVYAKGNFFRECLSACTKGNYSGKGLQYIENWRNQASVNIVMMASIQKINQIAQEFLESNALKCHWSKDNASLLKIVRSFPSMESKRNFLKSLDCLGELLVLEEESGNFNMAAEIARKLGYIMKEVDLLEKTEKFADACMLIISHVLSNSLWVSGNRGWPLKSFPKIVELLDRAKLISRNVPGIFRASICAEADIILPKQSNLSEIMQCYRASKKYESLTGEILSLRKLLDCHFQVNQLKYQLDSKLHLDPKPFEDIISRNQVSVGTLVFVWNLWKAHSLTILECLDRIPKLDFMQPEGTFQFCFNYFGVRRLPDNLSNQLLNPDAAWARNVGRSFMQKSKVATVEACKFAPAAREFWHQEFISVGFKVLDVLQEIYKSCTLSKFNQSLCLLHIFDIARFFLCSKSVKLKDLEASNLQNFLQLSSKYFDFVFPLDFRHSFSSNMISLRETELSSNLLEEIFGRNVNGVSQLTDRQIGCAVVILLGYGKPNYSLFEKIAERLPMNSIWKSFIENLRRNMESDSAYISNLSYFVSKDAVSEAKYLPTTSSVAGVPLGSAGYSSETLSCKLHEALGETYEAYRKMYADISPSCFFYLVERLLDLVPHSDQSVYFTSKSSFVEYLVGLPSDANPVARLFTDKNLDFASIVEFAVGVLEHLLLNIEETVEWINVSNIDCTYYLPVLVLKMIVILCLLCMNWNVHFPLRRLDKTLTIPHIRALLPREFRGALEKNDMLSFQDVLVEAFEIIGDPLVVVASKENDRKIASPNAIFLDLSSFSCKNEILKTLFSTNTEASETTTAQSLKTTSTLRDDRNMQVKWDIVGEMRDAFDTLRRTSDEALKSFCLREKVGLEVRVTYLAAAVAQLAQHSSHSSEYEDFLGKATSMIDEFHMFFSLLDTSDVGVEEIRESLTNLEARMAADVRAILSMLVMMQNEKKMSEEVEDRKASNIAAVLSNLLSKVQQQQRAEFSQRKGKNKKKNKSSRKGKGGGRQKK